MKYILLAVTGLNPQVITEALYALYHEGRKVDAIHIITTRTGKEKIFSGLLSPVEGKLGTFFKEFDIDGKAIDCGPHTVHVLKDHNGLELDDIKDADDNEVLLKICLEKAFHFTGDPNTAVYFLVAGGRKTMTSCLTLAAQLYGRPQDRIYHVLVSPEFECCRDFWYPPRKSVLVNCVDSRGEPIQKSSQYAAIHLISIPFVSIRDNIAANLFDSPRSPAELMLSLIREKPKLLLVNLAEGKLVYGNQELDMHPAHLALYAWFTERKKKCDLKKNCRDCTECFVEAGEVLDDSTTLIRLYNAIAGSRLVTEMSDSGIASLNRENFNSYKSKIRKRIETGFGQSSCVDLEISAVGKKPDTRFGLRLEKERIRIVW